MAKKETLKGSFTDLSKQLGFVYPSSQIYGGLANAWDYGPLGFQLKENIKNLWLKEFVRKRHDVVGLDSSLILARQVWQASGHEASFSDPLIECKHCHNRIRVDKYIDDKLSTDSTFPTPKNYAGDKTSLEDINEYVKESNVSCEKCKSKDFFEAKRFNLMLQTNLGANVDDTVQTYLRPETAQGIFINFANVARTTKKRLPFGIAQAGKAFRNEITPKNFIFRTREFEQLEIEYFCEPGTDDAHFDNWYKEEMRFFTEVLGFKQENVRFVEIPGDALPHYSKKAGDFEYQFDFGWGEISTLANRTDYDLKAHSEASKINLSFFDNITNRKFIPYVIEPSIGLSRLVLAALNEAYDEVENENGEKRIVMRFDKKVAPVKFAVLPVVKHSADDAMKIFDEISEYFDCEFQVSNTIGKRFHNMDEIGVPFCISVDASDKVRIRFRDTEEQIEVAKEDLLAKCVELMK